MVSIILQQKKPSFGSLDTDRKAYLIIIILDVLIIAWLFLILKIYTPLDRLSVLNSWLELPSLSISVRIIFPEMLNTSRV